MRLPVLLVVMTVGAGQAAFGQFAPPVQPNPLSYGNGKIDANIAYRYIGQTVTACGGAYQTDPRYASFIMGVSPYETVVIFKPGTDPQVAARFSNQIVCATGAVEEPQEFMMGVKAVLYPTHVEVANVPPPQPGQAGGGGPCIDRNGMVHGRAGYGGGPRQGPLPPC